MGQRGNQVLLAKTQQELKRVWQRWRAGLPAATEEWPKGAAYLRESAADSMVGGAPAGQLESTLAMFAAKGIYVDWDDVYFENVTGTELTARVEFRELIERAVAGEYVAIGAYLSSRLFRNVEHAIAVKRDLKLHGVELTWMGKPTMDPRDPSAWMMERQTEVSDEWPARQTGWLVGLTKERLSREGAPTGGRQPEIWRVTERGPGRVGGRRGVPTKWELVEPLASVVREGAHRYLAGDSFQDLADWSQRTACAGRTPGGKGTDRVWWQWILQNVKLAGFQPVSMYMGFKPGKESPLPPPQRERELVKSVLPPLITLAQHRQILALAKQRHRGGPKRREGYRDELLSGIARDAGCGHGLHIKHHTPDGADFYVRCGERAIDRHGRFFRGGDAAAQLDALVAAMRFDDQQLIERIEAHLADAVRPEPRTAAPEPPELTQLRTALASVDASVLPDVHAHLSRRLAALSSTTRQAREAEPPSFREALTQLTDWKTEWGSAEIAEKNALLRAAGLTAYIEPVTRVGRMRAPKGPDLPPHSRLVAVEIAVPEFALAFAVVTGLVGAPGELHPSVQLNAPTRRREGSAPPRKRRRLRKNGAPPPAAPPPAIHPPIVLLPNLYRLLLCEAREHSDVDLNRLASAA